MQAKEAKPKNGQEALRDWTDHQYKDFGGRANQHLTSFDQRQIRFWAGAGVTNLVLDF
jgi:hypothetical protein